MPANTTDRTARQSARTRLPLTPKVAATRRGSHLPVSRAVDANQSFVVSPNVVSASRGRVAFTSTKHVADSFRIAPADLRRVRL